MNKRALGIFGGTFDPVHNAHLRVALDIFETLPLSGIRFVPSAQPPHRNNPGASAIDRLAMLRAAIADQPGFSTDDQELKRTGPSYTIDTLQAIRDELPDTALCLLLGMDAFCALPTWYRWRELLDFAHIVVMTRPGIEPFFAEQLQRQINPVIARDGNAIRQQLNGLVVFQSVTALHISATDIRSRLSEQRSARYLVPGSVANIIEQRDLYPISTPKSVTL